MTIQTQQKIIMYKLVESKVVATEIEIIQNVKDSLNIVVNVIYKKKLVLCQQHGEEQFCNMIEIIN